MLTTERRVTVASAAANAAKRFMTRAANWAELRPEIESQGLTLSNVEAILNPGNVTLSRPESELPLGDFKVYLVPTKNKAGITQQEAAALAESLTKAIVDASNRQNRTNVEKLKGELIETVEEFFSVDLDEDNDDASDYSSYSPHAQRVDGDIAEANRMAHGGY